MNPEEAARGAPIKPGALFLLRAVWGPGLLVMPADTDAGNIVTDADSGARWGGKLAPAPLSLALAPAIVQELTERIAGRGFGDLVRVQCGRIRGAAATALPIKARLRGRHRWSTVAILALVSGTASLP